MNFRQKFEQIKEIYTNPYYYSTTLLSSLAIGFILFYFTNYSLIVGNFGQIHANIQVITQIIFSILFGINISLILYKFKLLKSIGPVEYGMTTTGSMLGILVSGCPSCGITLSTYLGLASFFSSFPFLGLELKVLGILLLVYSINNLLENMGICKLNVKSNSKS